MLGETQDFDPLRNLVSEQSNSKERITEKAQTVVAQLTKAGNDVHEIQVPPPGKHPHQGKMSTVMTIFVIFSFLILILGSILVATSMATLRVKQIRQIGVMKTLDAMLSQISGMYLGMILLFCIVASYISTPLITLAAAGFYNQIAVLLNLEIRNTSIPYRVPLVQVALGIIVPIIAAAVLVIRGSRISVRNALDNHGEERKKVNTNSWTMKLSKFNFISETLLLSIRNVFRQRSRVYMTLGLVVTGGAMVVMAWNVSEAWNENLQQICTQLLNDLEVKEINAVGATNPIQWRILTTHAIHNYEHAIDVISKYRLRWYIEQLFRLLKAKGFAVESSELKTGWVYAN